MKNEKECGVGKRINEARKSLGYTSNQLSESCDISAEYLRQIESESKTPSLFVFIAICNALETSPNYLLRDFLTTKPQILTPEIDEMWRYALPREQGLISAMMKGAFDYIMEHR